MCHIGPYYNRPKILKQLRSFWDKEKLPNNCQASPVIRYELRHMMNIQLYILSIIIRSLSLHQNWKQSESSVFWKKFNTAMNVKMSLVSNVYTSYMSISAKQFFLLYLRSSIWKQFYPTLCEWQPLHMPLFCISVLLLLTYVTPLPIEFELFVVFR